MTDEGSHFNRIKQTTLYKTEYCRNWAELGHCRYGRKCRYAHGDSELRTIPRHDRYKTQICRAYHVEGACPYGTRCTFIHDIDRPSFSFVRNESRFFANPDRPIWNSKLGLVIDHPISNTPAALPRMISLYTAFAKSPFKRRYSGSSSSSSSSSTASSFSSIGYSSIETEEETILPWIKYIP
ncbi:uncharacterized protein BYT42DRAFT_487947 [Radiomyces spectabilis]|uniref:uncharacterized protein n=1 Tax=Radiomyces spectabilis TaxID=64574 RepID=UPI00221E6A18|nr:uncharacterized protein BYT42DRAFT_487947 [Radiomyces spectabilis]KAI8393910.1 hypothetical protein BYT42DRAFT_487947 [Radiomyces spectabilis]